MISKFKAFLGFGASSQPLLQETNAVVDTLERLDALRSTGAVSDSVVRRASKALLCAGASSSAVLSEDPARRLKPQQLRFERATGLEGLARIETQHGKAAQNGIRYKWVQQAAFDDINLALTYIKQKPERWKKQNSRTAGDGSKTTVFYCDSHVDDLGERCPAQLKIHSVGEKVLRPLLPQNKY